MKKESWDKHVMDGLLAVNKNLHKGGLLPEKAQRMLYGLEDCLCSGDGLSPQTAFRGANATDMLTGHFGVTSLTSLGLDNSLLPDLLSAYNF